MTSKLNISSGSSGGQQVTQHPTRRLDQTAVSMWMILGQSKAVAGAECNTVIELTQEHHIA